jgi:magnesium-transporting ATPase (P-type)
MENVGKIIVVTGIVLIIVGVFVWLFAGKLGWFGNLPGDIKIERPGFSLYVPIATMLLISVGLSFVIWLINRIVR